MLFHKVVSLLLSLHSLLEKAEIPTEFRDGIIFVSNGHGIGDGKKHLETEIIINVFVTDLETEISVSKYFCL